MTGRIHEHAWGYRGSKVIGILVPIVLLFGLVFLLTQFPLETDYLHLVERGIVPDVLYERAAGIEAVSGDPYRPTTELIAEHVDPSLAEALPADAPAGEAPRPPSALLIQTILALLSIEALMPVITVATMAVLVWIGWLVVRISGATPKTMLWITPLALVSLPVVVSISHSPILGLLAVGLLLASWSHRNGSWAGLALGAATGLRLWPGLVIVGFWLTGKRRLAYTALGAFLALNVVALTLPGIDLDQSISSLAHGQLEWINHNMNASLALVLLPYGVPPLVSTVVAVLIGLVAAVRNKALAVPITILAAIIASPLSWPTYALAALPLAVLYAHVRSLVPILVLTVPAVTWDFLPAKWLGHVHFVVLAVLFVLFSRLRPTTSEAAASQLIS